MAWSTVPFSKAHTALISASANLDLETIISILEPIKSDLQQLLASPPKSEKSRADLAKKVIKIDGEEVEVNDAFLNDAARVADELNLDELIAAQLVFYSIEDSKRLQASAVESALTLYYVRRQYILDIVRFAVESLPETSIGIALGPESNRLNLIFDALKAVERSMEDLDEKMKTVEFMELSKNAEFTQIINMQRSFLVKEHESLGNVLYVYFQVAASSENRSSTLVNLLNHLADFDVLDSRILAYFPALVVWFSAKHTDEFTTTLSSYFTAPATRRWKLSYWRAGLELIAFTTLADEERTLPPSLDYGSLLNAVRHAIDEGGLEFWMSLSYDINSALGDAYYERFRDLVRLRVPNFTFWQLVPSTIMQENLQRALETLATLFITNLADILKEMRLSEEDMYLAMNELEEDTQIVSPGVDLERFFLFVAITYRGHPESSQAFFENEGDALHGFLLWAADCQVTFMAATFTELVAALANDINTCKCVHEFLISGIKRTAQNDDRFILTWPSIYDVIGYYMRGMSTPQSNSGTSADASSSQVADNFAMPGLVTLSSSHFQNSHDVSPVNGSRSALSRIASAAASDDSISRRNASLGLSQHVEIAQQDGAFRSVQNTSQWGLPMAGNSHSGGAPSSQQPSQLSDDAILVLSAYFGLIARVSVLDDARVYLRGKASSQPLSDSTSSDNRDIVPLLFKLLKLKQPITGAILSSLVPFVDSSMWLMLDSFILGRFDEALLSLQDALAFIILIRSLIEKCEIKTPHIGEYIDFVLKTVLPWTTNKEESDQSNSNERSSKNIKNLLQLNSLSMLRVLLAKNPHSDIAFKACFNASVYHALFSVLATGIDQINELEASHPLAQSVTRSVQVVHQLVQLSNSPSWSFDKPVLYHLQVVPHLALYGGSQLRELSLASIKLLALLDKSPEFKPTINRQSRILSILSSTTEATRIRVGLMSRLETNDTDISVKLALLEWITDQLRDCGSPKNYMTVAHYLLGFRQSELGLELKLELDSGIGGISSGSSLLSAVCDTLLQNLLLVNQGDIRLLRLCCETLWHLVEDSLTSEMLLDYLRGFDYWLNTIKCEFVNAGITDYKEDIMEYRSMILDIWISELQLCQKRLLLTVEGHYLDALVPMVFTLLDLSNLPKSLPALKCLNSWCRLIPVLISSGDTNTGATFIARIIQMLVRRLPEYSRESADFAVPVANLLVFLFDKYQQKGSDDSVARHMRDLFEAVLLSFQPAEVSSKLRSDLYAICFQNLKLVLQKGSQETKLEALSMLNNCGARIFQIACDDILGYPNETLRLGALLFIQLSAALSRQMNSSLVSNALLQYNFVSVFVQQLLGPSFKYIVSLGSGGHNNAGFGGFSAHNIATVADLRSLTSRSNDNNSTNKTSSGTAGTNSSSVQTDEEQKKVKFIKISFSLLRHIAETRDGASNILGAGILKLLESVFSNLNDEFLLLVVQLLIAIVVSMGSDNSPVLNEVRALLERNSSITENVLHRDAALSHALQDQTAESEVSHLARNFTILISLTGASA